MYVLIPIIVRIALSLVGLAIVVLAGSGLAVAGPNDTPGGPRGGDPHGGGDGGRGGGGSFDGVCVPDPAFADAENVHLFGLSAHDLEGQFFGDPDTADDGSFADQGFSPVRITGYTAGKETLFATRWTKVEQDGWTSRYDMTAEEFDKRFSELKGTHRMIDVGAYTTPDGEVRYTDIWVTNYGYSVYVLRDIPFDKMDSHEADMKDQGYVPLRIEGYHLDGELHYITLWAKGDCKWDLKVHQTASQHDATIANNLNNLRLAHVDSYIDEGRQRYSSIWHSQAPGPVQVQHHTRHWYLLQRDSNANLCAGYVMDTLYASEGSPFPYYGTVWTFNEAPDVDEDSPFMDRVRKQVECANGRAGFRMYNLTTGGAVSLYSHLPYGTSSTIKVPILYALLRQADAEGYSLYDVEIPSGAEYGANQGDWIDESDPAAEYTLDYLVRAMIDSSNNWATNRLIDFLATGDQTGFDVVNAEMELLGLANTVLRRYMTGDGAPSNNGTTGPVGDYKAGFDNTTTPNDMVGLLIAIHGDDGGYLLSNGNRDYFWEILDLNGGGDFVEYNSEAVADPWGGLADVASKGGSNGFSGVPGDFAAKPQIGTHEQRSSVGRIIFENGDVVFYAAYIDEADSEQDAIDFLGCTGMEVFRHYTGETTGVTPLACQ